MHVNRLTSFRVCNIGFRSPGPSLYIPPLLQGKHKSTVANDNLACIQALKYALWRRTPKYSLIFILCCVLVVLLFSEALSSFADAMLGINSVVSNVVLALVLLKDSDKCFSHSEPVYSSRLDWSRLVN